MMTDDVSQLKRQLDEERKARQDAERSLADERFLLNALMETIPDHLYFKDRESRFIRISTFLAESFGLADPAKAVGKTDFDYFTPEHAQQARADEIAVMESGHSLILEEKETWLDRPDTWVSTTKAPLYDAQGNVVGTFGISKDVTERRRVLAQMEAQMHELNALNARLIETQNELVRAEKNASLIRIIAGISHKLNTPLGNGKLALSTCDDEMRITHGQLASGKMTQSGLQAHLTTFSEAAKIASDSIDAALQLVDDFRKVIVDYGLDHIETFRLGEFINHQVDALRERFPGEILRIALGIEADFEISTYRDLLARALAELLKNAVVYGVHGKPGSGISIGVKHDNDLACIVIEDEGVGLPAEQQHHVFDGFFTTRLGAANGLGLVIVHNIVTGPLGGRIEAENRPQGGARFVLSLPLSLEKTTHLPQP